MVQMIKLPHLTILGRSLLLMICELAVNATCWAVAGILFARNKDTRPTLGLALLAWTLGLRHALDADHISAIDNATRCLIKLEQFSVTCGLFFSLGHSTIVILVTVAIAISSDVYQHINGVGEVGGIIGAAVSGTFLFIIGLANSIILLKLLRRRREEKTRKKRRENGETVEDVQYSPQDSHMLMMRILGPIINFVNRPWKMYPVGVLFGLGFDTASSIALLAVSALAKKNSDGHSIPSSHIIILPFLFTAGMTLIDSADSVLMLHSYAGAPLWPIQFFSWQPLQSNSNDFGDDAETSGIDKVTKACDIEKNIPQPPSFALYDNKPKGPAEPDEKMNETIPRDSERKLSVMSGLNVLLTLLSILVAFSISLITIMGLIGEQCRSCVAAAEADDGHGGGLAGRWWRAWAKAGDQSGYIGIGIVGMFIFTVSIWYGGKWAAKTANERSGKT
ncbi:hypothetical protein HYPSUDRAFT_66594 [Hypholoma sublateritium FD-334 SS-4]|uniref:Nickel/cobalt efflux system n=1 Tax=Hypholoma sublateritium (strain FD-334 SS-4) TaxID=945553 RepID=A0A0D2PU09_HYPSF|nr:hypothetical protein HYPSUDRAFT_66594 [Hypholoma sublateritium FD-334 SS-4]